MNKILFIVGPTAVGKTNFALNIARKISGEIVNADSVQVYKGLDIISGKDTPKNSKVLNSSILFKGFRLKNYLFKGVIVHLLDIAEPSYSFNLHDFVKISKTVVKDIWLRKKTPIVVGGNGYYIDSFFNKISTLNIPPNISLRKELGQASLEELRKILEKANFYKLTSMNNSDRNNKRRLIRAIEVVKDNKKRENIQTLNFDSLIVGLRTSKEVMVRLVEKRVDSRLKKGALKEAEELFKNFDNLSFQVKKAIGYKELFTYLRGEMSMEESIEAWKKAELSYVKKQITWFKKNEKIIWVDPNMEDDIKEIESKVIEWYNQTYK